MHLGGLQKTSLIDYPGKVSCVLFLAGCNFKCPYCHNPELVNRDLWLGPCLSEKTIYNFLERRRGLLDGVVISGGEPTLQKDLVLLCEKIKGLGYPIKLDTNGSRPKVIKRLINEGIVDYIAMDIKTSPFLYRPVISKTCKPEWILTSIRIILESAVPYEFRTTCLRPIVNERVIEEITRIIKGGSRYVLQRFCRHKVLQPDYFDKVGSVYDERELFHLKSIAEPWVDQCIIR